MLVQFAPTGDVKDTNQVTPLRGYAGGPYALPVIGAGAGTTNVQYGGRITNKAQGGSPLGLAPASGGRAFLLWKTPSNATVASWKMNSVAAANTAITNIAAALAAGDAIVVINAAGAVVP